MGHSVAAKAIDGCKRCALSMTIPQWVLVFVHRRMVYVELETGANFTQVR